MATYTSVDIDQLAEAAFAEFTSKLLPFRAFSTNFSPEVAAKGASVTVPVIQSVTANVFDGDGYEKDGGAMDAVQVVLNKHLVSSFPITDVQANQGNFSTLQKQGAMHGKAVAKLALTTIWADITTANWPTPAHTGAASNFDSDDVIDIRTAATAADMPDDGRSMVLDEAYYGNLLKDDGFKIAANYGARTAIVEGNIPRAFGFDMFESTIVPGNSQNLVGFAAHSSAYALAARLPDPRNNTAEGFSRPVQYRIVSESVGENGEPLGLALGVRVHSAEKTGALWISYETLFGFVKSGLAGSLLRITSATT
jgi:hypothetical protein